MNQPEDDGGHIVIECQESSKQINNYGDLEYKCNNID